jgi:hypothetical protein
MTKGLGPKPQQYGAPQLLLFFFGGGVVLGLELRAFTLSHSTPALFVMGFFEIQSRKHFAQAGFELQSS